MVTAYTKTVRLPFAYDVCSLRRTSRCADGYMGQRCEFKDLDGSYLRNYEHNGSSDKRGRRRRRSARFFEQPPTKPSALPSLLAMPISTDAVEQQHAAIAMQESAVRQLKPLAQLPSLPPPPPSTKARQETTRRDQPNNVSHHTSTVAADAVDGGGSVV